MLPFKDGEPMKRAQYLAPLALVLLLVSFLPTAVLNGIYWNDWSEGRLADSERLLLGGPFVPVLISIVLGVMLLLISVLSFLFVARPRRRD